MLRGRTYRELRQGTRIEALQLYGDRIESSLRTCVSRVQTGSRSSNTKGFGRSSVPQVRTTNVVPKAFPRQCSVHSDSSTNFGSPYKVEEISTGVPLA